MYRNISIIRFWGSLYDFIKNNKIKLYIRKSRVTITVTNLVTFTRIRPFCHLSSSSIHRLLTPTITDVNVPRFHGAVPFKCGIVIVFPMFDYHVIPKSDHPGLALVLLFGQTAPAHVCRSGLSLHFILKFPQYHNRTFLSFSEIYYPWKKFQFTVWRKLLNSATKQIVTNFILIKISIF